MKKFKSILALVLSVIMIFSCVPFAFAQQESATPVIIVSGMGAKPLTNADEGKEVFPPAADVIALNVLKAILPVLGTLALSNGDIFDKYAAAPIHEIFSQLACDTDGKSVNNIVPKLYPEAAENYEEIMEIENATNEMSMVVSTARKIGYDKVYYFNYDWRLSPLDIAEDLNAMIEKVKSEQNSDKVSLFAMSMGGTITNAYIHKYGAASLDNVVYASTAFLGVDLVGQLLTGDIDLNVVSVLTYLASFAAGNGLAFVSTVVNALNEAAKRDGMEYTDAFIRKNVEAIKDTVFNKVFNDAFITFHGIWGLLPNDKFDKAVETMRGYVALSDSFIEKAREYNEIQKNVGTLIKKAEAQGTKVYIIGAYGYSGIPLTTASTSHTDTLIDTYHMTGKCVVAPFGKTLSDIGEYSTEGMCGNKSHFHISKDNIINAGVGMLPDRTWIIKNMGHVEFASDHETSALAVYILTSKQGVDVYSDSRYPQFTELDRENGKLISLTENVVIPGTEEASAPTGIKAILTKILDVFKTLIGYIKGYFSKDVA